MSERVVAVETTKRNVNRVKNGTHTIGQILINLGYEVLGSMATIDGQSYHMENEVALVEKPRNG